MSYEYGITKIQIRRDTSANFSSVNPILRQGEPAFTLDTNTLKIGDGITAWTSLSGISRGITQEDLDNAISSILDAAPETLNTLNELAAAINDNPNFFNEVAYSGGNISQFNNDVDYLISEANDLTANVTWANVPDANITESSVVQHSGALELTESQIVDLQSYLLNVVEDTSPQLGGNLDINSNNIIGSGNINISGNITANSGNFDQLIFNTSLNDPDLSQGQLQWNSTEGTLDLGFTDTYAQHMGEELHYRVRNNTGSTLTKGTAVYASGLTPGGNNRIEIAPFTADGSVREVRFMGLVTENISNGVNGYTTQFGYIRGIDTRGDAASNGYASKLWDAGEPSWSEGDILYAHPTVAGKLTKVEPKHNITVAILLNRHQNQGKIFVRPTSFGHLEDDHDVSISGVAQNDVLVYNSGTDLWENNSKVVFSDTAGITGAIGVNNIVQISQSDYDNLGSYIPNTIYFITETSSFTPPSQVTGLAVDDTGDGTIDLSWTAPASEAAISDYSVEYTPSGGSATTVLVGSSATSYQLTGLTNDTEYSVRVAAVSAGGTGSYSAAVTGTPGVVGGISYVSGWSGDGTVESPASTTIQNNSNSASFTALVSGTMSWNWSFGSDGGESYSHQLFENGNSAYSQNGENETLSASFIVTAGSTYYMRAGFGYHNPTVSNLRIVPS